MSRKANLSAAELARRIEQHLPVFARPMVDDLIAAVQREERTHFYDQVCAEAETIMQHTGTVSGAHYNAMRRLLGNPSPRRHEAETPD